MLLLNDNQLIASEDFNTISLLISTIYNPQSIASKNARDNVHIYVGLK